MKSKFKIISILLAMTLMLTNIMVFATGNSANGSQLAEEAMQTELVDKQAEHDNRAVEQIKRELKTKNSVSELEAMPMLFSSEVGITSTSAGMEYTISGIISLPVSNPKTTTIWIYADAPAVDSNSKIIRSAPVKGSVKEQLITINAGSTSAPYTLTLAPGKYIIYAYVESTSSAILVSGIYHNSTASVQNRYAASIIDISAGNATGKNITMAAAERTVSGTITLSTAAPAGGGYIAIDLYSEESSGDSYYVRFPVSAGSKTVEYSIGVKSGKYTLCCFADDGRGRYYDGTAYLTSSWSRAAIIDTTALSQNDISFNVGSAMTSSDDKTLNITINFTTPITETTDYDIDLLYDIWEDGSRYYTVLTKTVRRSVGVNTITTSATGLPAGNFKIGYGDDSYYFYYASGNSVTLKDTAAAVVNTSTVNSITINEPTLKVITAYVSMGNYPFYPNSNVYAEAKFTNGNVYSVSVFETSAVSNVQIPIKVLGTESGSFDLTSATDNPNGSGSSDYDARSVSTLQNQTLTTGASYPITLNDPQYTKLSGAFSMPFAAEGDGTRVQITYSNYNNELTFYYMQKEQMSVNYELYVSYISATILYGYAFNPPANVYNSSNVDFGTTYTNINFCLPKIVKFTTTISIPEGDTLANPLTGTIRLGVINSLSYESYSKEVTILAGSKSASAIFEIPEGRDVTISLNQNSSSRYASFSYYCTGGSTMNGNAATAVTISDNGSMNFLLKPLYIVKGTVYMPDLYVSPEVVYAHVYVEGKDSSETYPADSRDTIVKVRWDPDSFSITIPLEVTDTQYYLYYSVYSSGYSFYSDGVDTTPQIYVNKDGSTTYDKSKASVYSFEDYEIIDFKFKKNSTMHPIHSNITSTYLTLYDDDQNFVQDMSLATNFSFYLYKKSDITESFDLIVTVYDKNNRLKSIDITKGNGTFSSYSRTWTFADKKPLPKCLDGEYITIMLWYSNSMVPVTTKAM